MAITVVFMSPHIFVLEMFHCQNVTGFGLLIHFFFPSHTVTWMDMDLHLFLASENVHRGLWNTEKNRCRSVRHYSVAHRIFCVRLCFSVSVHVFGRRVSSSGFIRATTTEGS